MNDILEDVKTILDDRAKDYGNYRKMLEKIASRWSITLNTIVTPEQVALCMIDLKLSRLSNNIANRDSLIDVIGYTVLIDQMNVERFNNS